jgi:hypothetical protein
MVTNHIDFTREGRNVGWLEKRTILLPSNMVLGLQFEN